MRQIKASRMLTNRPTADRISPMARAFPHS
jgi:hypothetical protein